MGFWALRGNIMNMCVTTVAVSWLSFAVKGFWAVWENNITVVMAVLLREACCVHVLTYNTAQLLQPRKTNHILKFAMLNNNICFNLKR
jgi:hypothetical protein